MVEAGPPPAIRATTATISACGGRPPKPPSSVAQPATVTRQTPTVNGTRGAGNRPKTTPTAGLSAMAASTQTSRTAPAPAGLNPCATRYGRPQRTENIVVTDMHEKCTQKPSRVPGVRQAA